MSGAVIKVWFVFHSHLVQSLQKKTTQPDEAATIMLKVYVSYMFVLLFQAPRSIPRRTLLAFDITEVSLIKMSSFFISPNYAEHQFICLFEVNIDFSTICSLALHGSPKGLFRQVERNMEGF